MKKAKLSPCLPGPDEIVVFLDCGGTEGALFLLRYGRKPSQLERKRTTPTSWFYTSELNGAEASATSEPLNTEFWAVLAYISSTSAIDQFHRLVTSAIDREIPAFSKAFGQSI